MDRVSSLILAWTWVHQKSTESRVYSHYFVDLNECLTEPCHPNALCTDILGGFSCSCKGGFTGNETFCEGRRCMLLKLVF